MNTRFRFAFAAAAIGFVLQSPVAGWMADGDNERGIGFVSLRTGETGRLIRPEVEIGFVSFVTGETGRPAGPEGGIGFVLSGAKEVAGAAEPGGGDEQAAQEPAKVEPSKAAEVKMEGPKAPEEVEQGVRKAIADFYRLQVEGRFRQSESLVCEESKDEYYNMDKPKILGFELVTLKFEEGFQKAQAKVHTDREFITPHARFPMKVPAVTNWESGSGKWCMQLPKPDPRGKESPFGFMNPGKVSDAKPGDPAAAKQATQEQVRSGIRLSKREVVLKAGMKAVETVDVENNLAGGVKAEVLAFTIPGLKVSPTEQGMAAMSKLPLKLEWDGTGKPGRYEIRVDIQPVNMLLPLRVVVQ